MKIAAIIPCYDVVDFCEKVIEESLDHCDQIILVDDGSRDGTGQIVDRFARENAEKVHLIQFPENRGKGFVLLSGIQYALEKLDADVIVTLDGDGQHQPSDIPLLAAEVERGADFVIGERMFRKMPFYSKIANTIFALLLWCLFYQAPVMDTQSGFRAFSRSFAREIARSVLGGRYEMECHCLLLALKQKRQVVRVSIPTIYINKNSSSHFRKIRDSLRILKVLVAYVLRKR